MKLCVVTGSKVVSILLKLKTQELGEHLGNIRFWNCMAHV